MEILLGFSFLTTWGDMYDSPPGLSPAWVRRAELFFLILPIWRKWTAPPFHVDQPRGLAVLDSPTPNVISEFPGGAICFLGFFAAFSPFLVGQGMPRQTRQTRQIFSGFGPSGGNCSRKANGCGSKFSTIGASRRSWSTFPPGSRGFLSRSPTEPSLPRSAGELPWHRLGEDMGPFSCWHFAAWLVIAWWLLFVMGRMAETVARAEGSLFEGSL